LAGAPRQSPGLLKGRVEALAARADPKKLARLIADLDADEFEVRQKARQELAGLGRAAEGALRRALAGSVSVEARRHLLALLKGLEVSAAPSQAVIALRVIEVMERAGSAEARAVLEGLAKGGQDKRVKEEAKASLKRLARRAGR
jgi:hypothetical protein